MKNIFTLNILFNLTFKSTRFFENFSHYGFRVFFGKITTYEIHFCISKRCSVLLELLDFYLKITETKFISQFS